MKKREYPQDTVPPGGGSLIISLLRRLRQECRKHSCAYGVLTDGQTTCTFEYTPDADPEALTHDQGRTEIVEDSIIKIVSSMIFDEAYKTGLCRRDLPDLFMNRPVYQGALNEPAIPPLRIEDYRSYSAFDIYTMANSKPYFDFFMKWKSEVRKQAVSRPVQVGDTLTVDISKKRGCRQGDVNDRQYYGEVPALRIWCQLVYTSTYDHRPLLSVRA